ncbi:DUF2637 domain-containing protein [Streptomyces sp. NC-S4]
MAAGRYVLAAAGAVIILLTAAGFWLSYAHLAEVAGAHGLAAFPIRQWAWPATLDAFVVIGELLMLHAALRRERDGWAVALTAIGSVGSIALNVAGVSGTGGAPVPVLNYVVAAVPPTAALLAFGVLMRRIHALVAVPAALADAEATPSPVAERHRPARPEAADRHADGTASPTPVAPTAHPVDRHLVNTPPTGQDTDVSKQRTSPATPAKTAKPRLPRASMDQIVEIGRTTTLGVKGRYSRRNIEAAVRAKGLSISKDRAEEGQRRLQAELDETRSAS